MLLHTAVGILLVGHKLFNNPMQCLHKRNKLFRKRTWPRGTAELALMLALQPPPR